MINFMFFVAEELRLIMAELGFRTVSEMVGQTDVLEFSDVSNHPKARHLDLSVILHKPDLREGDTRYRTQDQDHGLAQSLDAQKLIELAQPAMGDSSERGVGVPPARIKEFQRGQDAHATVRAELEIKNIHRTVGTTLSGLIAQKYGHVGLPDDTIHFKFTGSAGQSFGCFLAHGITLELKGDANDYLGKGLSGGKIIVYPSDKASFKPEENIIAGNVIAYGAIAGELYIHGVVGERFCVRNSGVEAVVEGVGDHGCEYMTGGRVVVIGPTGRNFAAGMSGGIAYVYDDNGMFPKLANLEMVELETPDKPEDRATIKRLLENHLKYTGSTKAKAILDD